MENKWKEKFEMEDEAKLRAFNEQMHNNQMTGQQNPPQQLYSNVDPNLLKTDNDQALIDRVNMTPGGPTPELATSFGKCPQCGTFHPPVKQGEKCPVAPVKSKDGEELDLNPFFAQLKNILTSQIEQKGIKDVPKMVKLLIVNITQFLEGYNE